MPRLEGSRRGWRALSALLGLAGLSGPVAAQPAAVAPEQAPAEWVAYAQQVNDIVGTWLSGEEPELVQLRTDLLAQEDTGTADREPLVLKLWIDRAGVISDASASAPTQAAGDQLRTLLVGRSLGVAPPAGMLLPLRLALDVAPAPAADPVEAEPPR